MLYIIHTLVGILIASKFSSLWLIAVLALASHFILDIIPHRDSIFKPEDFQKKINLKKSAVIFELTDALISLFLIIFFYLKLNNPLIIMAVFFSLLPDIVKLFWLTPLKNNKLFQKHIDFHIKIQTETSWILGLFIQLVIAVITLFLI